MKKHLNHDGKLNEYFRFNFDQKLESIEQKMIKVNDIVDRKGAYPSIKVKKYSTKYSISKDSSRFEKRKKILGIITIKNNSKMLEYTLDNLRDKSFYDYCDLLVVDDRSTEDIKEIVLKNNCMYVRADYDGLFNFSMVNNIGALFAIQQGYDEILFWNSDLWIPDDQSFREIEDDKRMTIQFGGCEFDSQPHLGCFFVRHAGRYLPHDSFLHSQNHHIPFVTAAITLIKSSLFRELSGFNPSLKINFQDLDLCLRACELGHIPYYVGKDCHFYHDEGIELGSSHYEEEKLKDALLYSKIWAYNRIMKILGKI